MGLAVVRSRAIIGLEAPLVAVEVHVANGLPAFTIVGLPQAEVRESRDRVRAALVELDFEFPNRRITVNLAPADLPKGSGGFDLPIALGILCATHQLPLASIDQIEAVGELSLTGELRPIHGALALALALKRTGQARTLVLPRANATEASLIGGVTVEGFANLRDVCNTLMDVGRAPPGKTGGHGNAAPGEADRMPAGAVEDAEGFPDLADVRGHAAARRVLEICAAGRHSVLFVGPPGAGKTMLAQRLPGLLPRLTEDEAAESAALTSLSRPFDPSRWRVRPFRAPHHSASSAALVGGGGNPRPGEISLAHHGVLFLDELPEFPRHVLEALREPLEHGRITVSRALRQVDLPARFQLIAAMNPCPCGYLGDARQRCRCTPEQVLRYRSRLSGPLLDRIDLRLEVVSLAATELLGAPVAEASRVVRERVVTAQARQFTRQGCLNADLAPARIEAHCAAEPSALLLLHRAIAALGLSGRATHRVLKVARSIADLAGATGVQAAHVGEALQYRRLLELPAGAAPALQNAG